MNTQTIFGAQFVLSLVAFGIVAEFAARLREDDSAPAQEACAPSPSRVQLVPTLIGAGT